MYSSILFYSILVCPICPIPFSLDHPFSPRQLAGVTNGWSRDFGQEVSKLWELVSDNEWRPQSCSRPKL